MADFSTAFLFRRVKCVLSSWGLSTCLKQVCGQVLPQVWVLFPPSFVPSISGFLHSSCLADTAVNRLLAFVTQLHWFFHPCLGYGLLYVLPSVRKHYLLATSEGLPLVKNVGHWTKSHFTEWEKQCRWFIGFWVALDILFTGAEDSLPVTSERWHGVNLPSPWFWRLNFFNQALSRPKRECCVVLLG